MLSAQQPAITKHFPQANQLIFGAMGLGGGWNNSPISKSDISQAHDIIDTCLTLGINMFDHADIYTFGKAEQVFGEVIKQRPELREQLIIQSKCGIRFESESAPKRYDFSASWIKQSVNKSLQRLALEQLDTLLLHRPDPLVDIYELAETVSTLKQQGKIKHLGVSNMNQAQMSLLQHVLGEPVICNQLEMSLSHLSWLEDGVTSGCSAQKATNFASGTIEYCQINNVQLQAWGSLSQGLFSGQDVSQHHQSVKQTAELVTRLASEYQVAREAIVLAWLMRHPANIQPVIGTTNLERLKACYQAHHIQLSREHWYALFVSARGQELP